jgi:hypothetical protein
MAKVRRCLTACCSVSELGAVGKQNSMASLTGLFDDLSSPGVRGLKRIHAIWFEGLLYATSCIQVTV